ncbi:SDR family oxidoreductase [Sphaerisporangium corydalis]|uniref:SDR family oxidoreductase n=1 Tax=Sphaerisporangium corydalis TaxID=1441875 RepID=A0ABV9E6N2_9ACTN|nr:SDR family oxidoreductase [Sphaerisporangium corydalis]
MVGYDYSGRVVLVTGGSRGIGAGIASAFLGAGAEVVVCARTPPERPPQEPEGGAGPFRQARHLAADVRDPGEVDRLLGSVEEAYGRLDVLVNNAGGSPYALVAGTSPRLHAKIIELNLTAPLLVSQRAHPLLSRTAGSVIMIGSVSGDRPSPGTSAYGAAKAGLHHLAGCLAAEWAPLVRVNTVVVGLAETESAADHYAAGPERVAATVPSGRMARPQDVAEVCLWLGCPGYVTGARIHVHGGGEIPAWRQLQ